MSTVGFSEEKTFHERWQQAFFKNKLRAIDFNHCFGHKDDSSTDYYFQQRPILSHQASRHYRTLPCLKYKLLGACPYEDRCTYLHGPRIDVEQAINDFLLDEEQGDENQPPVNLKDYFFVDKIQPYCFVSTRIDPYQAQAPKLINEKLTVYIEKKLFSGQ